MSLFSYWSSSFWLFLLNIIILIIVIDHHRPDYSYWTSSSWLLLLIIIVLIILIDHKQNMSLSWFLSKKFMIFNILVNICLVYIRDTNKHLLWINHQPSTDDDDECDAAGGLLWLAHNTFRSLSLNCRLWWTHTPHTLTHTQQHTLSLINTHTHLRVAPRVSVGMLSVLRSSTGTGSVRSTGCCCGCCVAVWAPPGERGGAILSSQHGGVKETEHWSQ